MKKNLSKKNSLIAKYNQVKEKILHEDLKEVGHEKIKRIENFPFYFLLGLIFVVGGLLLHVISPFVVSLIFGGIVATVTYPFYKKMLSWCKGREGVASILSSLIVIFAFVVPLLLFVILLSKQAIEMYKFVEVSVQGNTFDNILKWRPGNFVYDNLGQYREQVTAFIETNKSSLKTGITDSAKFVSTFLATQSARILTGVGGILFKFLLLAFSLYFFYKDGERIVAKIMRISPIPVVYEKEIFNKFAMIGRATMFGTLLTAIVQGFLAFLIFSIAGVPSAFFWATGVSIFSLVPVVGTATVWLPVGLFMILSGKVFGGILVLVLCFSLVTTVDNFLRVIFIGTTSKLNPLLTFVSVFGGILTFGLVGVIFGPMLMVLFMTLLDIYERGEAGAKN